MQGPNLNLLKARDQDRINANGARDRELNEKWTRPLQLPWHSYESSYTISSDRCEETFATIMTRCNDDAEMNAFYMV